MHFSIARDAGEPVGYEQYTLAINGHKQDILRIVAKMSHF